VKSRIRIRIKVKIQELSRLKKEPGWPWTLKMETWTLKMEAWRVCRLLVADSHQLHEEQDPDPN
jgi:hypothetical protein